MVAAPMPGLEPENISVTIAGVHLTIRGEEWGPGQHERDPEGGAPPPTPDGECSTTSE